MNPRRSKKCCEMFGGLKNTFTLLGICCDDAFNQLWQWPVGAVRRKPIGQLCPSLDQPWAQVCLTNRTRWHLFQPVSKEYRSSVAGKWKNPGILVFCRLSIIRLLLVASFSMSFMLNNESLILMILNVLCCLPFFSFRVLAKTAAIFKFGPVASLAPDFLPF